MDSREPREDHELAACPHEYGPTRVGHGEAQCKWCLGTNRENAVIAPNHCTERVKNDPAWNRRPSPVAESTPTAPEMATGDGEAVAIRRDVFNFLMGTGALGGYYFGERRPDMKGAFWWRSVMCASISPRPDAQKAESTPSPDTEGVSVLPPSPESYVRDFIAHGESSAVPLQPWEQAYQDAGLVEQAERDGYIWIARDVACTVTVTPVGRKIANLYNRLEAALRTAQNTGRDEVLELRELLRQTMNALACADKNDPNEPIADNGMTVWDGMKAEAERLWPRVTTALSSPPVSTVDEEGGGS